MGKGSGDSSVPEEEKEEEEEEEERGHWSGYERDREILKSTQPEIFFCLSHSSVFFCRNQG